MGLWKPLLMFSDQKAAGIDSLFIFWTLFWTKLPHTRVSVRVERVQRKTSILSWDSETIFYSSERIGFWFYGLLLLEEESFTDRGKYSSRRLIHLVRGRAEKNRNQHSSKNTDSYESVGILGPTFLGVWGKLAACHVILQHWFKVLAPPAPLKD